MRRVVCVSSACLCCFVYRIILLALVVRIVRVVRFVSTIRGVRFVWALRIMGVIGLNIMYTSVCVQWFLCCSVCRIVLLFWVVCVNVYLVAHMGCYVLIFAQII